MPLYIVPSIRLALMRRGTKRCSKGPSHMTSMGSMSIYDKKLLKSSFPEAMDKYP